MRYETRTVGLVNSILFPIIHILIIVGVGKYFKRVHGPREGQRLFDDYSTITVATDSDTTSMSVALKDGAWRVIPGTSARRLAS